MGRRKEGRGKDGEERVLAIQLHPGSALDKSLQVLLQSTIIFSNLFSTMLLLHKFPNFFSEYIN